MLAGFWRTSGVRPPALPSLQDSAAPLATRGVGPPGLPPTHHHLRADAAYAVWAPSCQPPSLAAGSALRGSMRCSWRQLRWSIDLRVPKKATRSAQCTPEKQAPRGRAAMHSYPLVDLNANGTLGDVPHDASLALVPLVGHTLGSRTRGATGYREWPAPLRTNGLPAKHGPATGPWKQATQPLICP